MKVKIKILICTGLMLNDHSNPYIETTVLYFLIILLTCVYMHNLFIGTQGNNLWRNLLH